MQSPPPTRGRVREGEAAPPWRSLARFPRPSLPQLGEGVSSHAGFADERWGTDHRGARDCRTQAVGAVADRPAAGAQRHLVPCAADPAAGRRAGLQLRRAGAGRRLSGGLHVRQLPEPAGALDRVQEHADAGAARHADLPARRLSARLFPGGQVERALAHAAADPGDRAVLDQLPHPHLCLDLHPRRRAASRPCWMPSASPTCASSTRRSR